MEVENEYHKTEKRAALLVLKFKLAIRLKVTFIFEKITGFKGIHTCGYFYFLNLCIVQKTIKNSLKY